MRENKTIDILGTAYTIEKRKMEDDEKLQEADGYIDTSVKLIVIDDMQPEQGKKLNLEGYAKQVIRHEIVHAFLFESGMDSSTYICRSGWAQNEEMVDWFAIQFPKILKAFKAADAL
mgnify:CR=1 FL=1